MLSCHVELMVFVFFEKNFLIEFSFGCVLSLFVCSVVFKLSKSLQNGCMSQWSKFSYRGNKCMNVFKQGTLSMYVFEHYHPTLSSCQTSWILLF